MIDKPKEDKTLKPKKATPKKEETRKAEEIEQETEAVIPTPIPTPEEPEPQTMEDKPDETPSTNAVAEEPTPKTFDEQLFDIYKEASPGVMPLGQLMVDLNVDDPILIMQAWDRLFDQRKVPFSKLFKPPKGYVGFEP